MKVQTIRMMETTEGSPDGFTVRIYEQGRQYDVPADLAKAFVDDLGVAKREPRKPVVEVVDDRAEESAVDGPKQTRASAKRDS